MPNIKIEEVTLLRYDQYYLLSVSSISTPWWLRTMGCEKNEACCVFQSTDKKNRSAYNRIDVPAGVRPALRVLSKDNLFVGDTISYGGYTWSVIFKKDTREYLLLCDTIVAEMVMPSNSFCEWESSEMYAWLNNGFLQKIKNKEKEVAK